MGVGLLLLGGLGGGALPPPGPCGPPGLGGCPGGGMGGGLTPCKMPGLTGA